MALWQAQSRQGLNSASHLPWQACDEVLKMHLKTLLLHAGGLFVNFRVHCSCELENGGETNSREGHGTIVPIGKVTRVDQGGVGIS